MFLEKLYNPEAKQLLLVIVEIGNRKLGSAFFASAVEEARVQHLAKRNLEKPTSAAPLSPYDGNF